jgi:PEP-CTERM putative exosortase interaction domain
LSCRRVAESAVIALVALAQPAAAISPILQFDFTGGSTANTGTGSQTAAATSPGAVVASGGLDGSGSYQNHDTPSDGVHYVFEYGRFGGTGLDNDLRSITVTMWLKADVPFANGPNSNIPLFNTAGFNFSSREQSAGPTQQFGVSTGNSTQPVILLDKAANATPDFGAGDVGQWRFIALTLDMVYDGANTNTTVNLYRGSLTDPVSLWGSGFRTQDGDRTTEIDNAFAIGNDRNGDYFNTQRQFLGEIDDVRFFGSGGAGLAVLGQGALEEIRAAAVPEPETASLVAIGLLAIAATARRRRTTR